MVLVDQRCHGASSHIADLKGAHTIGASATDIAQLFRSKFGGRAPAMVCLPPWHCPCCSHPSTSSAVLTFYCCHRFGTLHLLPL